MSLEILTFGEALVEVMRVEIGQALDEPATFVGPYASGAPFIFLTQASRLGAKAGGIGAVGQDKFGDFLLHQFSEDGLDISLIAKLPDHTTGVAFVAYFEDGSREFVFHIRHAAAGQIHPNMIERSIFGDLKLLHLMGSSLSMHNDTLEMGQRALQFAQENATRISFDPNIRPQLLPINEAIQVFEPFMSAADVFLPTENELVTLTGQPNLENAADYLLERNSAQIIVVTRGEKGCTVITSDERFDVAGFPVNPVDPTGAGDCFDAGFIVEWLAGKPLSEAAKFANACGALAVSKQGPMEGARTRNMVELFLTEHNQTEI